MARVLARGLGPTVILAIIAIGAAPAVADTVADKKAQAAVLAQKISGEARQVEVMAEQYNGAQFHLTQVQQQLADAAQLLSGTQAATERDRAALAGEAVVAYMHGRIATSPTMTSFSGAVDLSVQQGYFQLATHNQAGALDRLRQSERALRQQQATLQAAQQDSRAALAAVTARQQAVQAAADASRATLSQVQGDLVQLVAQQQAQMATQQQAQVKTALLPVQARLTATGVATPAAPTAPTSLPVAPTPAPTRAGAGPTTTRAPTPTPAPTQGVAVPAPAPAPTRAPPVIPAPTTQAPKPPPPARPPSSGASAALAYARAQIGKPYQWGAAGPDSFDCSGLTMRAWEAGGVWLPHFAAAQFSNTAHVAIADLQPGDLVFFGSELHHVGIYVGGGQMINAPQTGELVKYSDIFWPDLQPYGGRPG